MGREGHERAYESDRDFAMFFTAFDPKGENYRREWLEREYEKLRWSVGAALPAQVDLSEETAQHVTISIQDESFGNIDPKYATGSLRCRMSYFDDFRLT